MSKYSNIALLVLVNIFTFACVQGAAVIDCQRPPQLVDPAKCCQDGGRDEITENCAKRMGITGQPNDAPPTVEMATCLAECILTESRYMPQPEQVSFENIRKDLQGKFANDSVYVETMFKSYQKCLPNVQRRMQAFKQMSAQQRHGCSPFSNLLLGCTYMEYFVNCPAHRWTQNAECDLAKQFVKQCTLAA